MLTFMPLFLCLFIYLCPIYYFAPSFLLFRWFRNPIKNYPQSQNNCGQKIIDNPHSILSNLAVIYYTMEKRTWEPTENAAGWTEVIFIPYSRRLCSYCKIIQMSWGTQLEVWLLVVMFKLVFDCISNGIQ